MISASSRVSGTYLSSQVRKNIPDRANTNKAATTKNMTNNSLGLENLRFLDFTG